MVERGGAPGMSVPPCSRYSLHITDVYERGYDMSTQTAHLGLHQWESTDSFLREDFNADNRKIDEAVGATEDKADRALAGLEGVSYNVYNLLLQNYYESKYTGYKKALIFDGFMDQTLISAVDNGLTWDSDGFFWLLDATGQGDFSYNWGSKCQIHLNSSNGGTCTTGEFMPEGGGTVTAVTLFMSGAVGCTVKLIQDGETIGSDYLKLDDIGSIKEYTFTMNAKLKPGRPCRLEVTSSNTNSDILVCGEENMEPGFQAAVTPSFALSGGITTAAFQLEEQGERLICWVRYEGVSIKAEVSGNNGEFLAMEAGECRITETMEGESCQEAEFMLEKPPAGPLTLRLTLRAAEQGDNVRLFDYGAVLL